MPDFAIRYDSATLELSHVKEDEDFLRCRVAFARTGVFPYVRSDGKILREAKLPEDLFSPQTIESAKGIAATNDHPPISDNEGLISTSNSKTYARGALGDSITKDESKLWGNATIWDADLKREILERKKIEISVGFRSTIVSEPGEFNGEAYDLKQTHIRFNHFAFVDQGRAGEEVRVYLDSADLPKNLDVAFQETRKGVPMKPKFLEKARALLDSAKALLDGDDTTDPAKKDEGLEAGTNADPAKKDEEMAGDGTNTDPSKENPDPAAKQDNPDVELLQTKIQLLEQLLKEHQDLLQKATSEATQDSLAMKRLKLIQTVQAVDSEAKTDGVSSKELKKLVVAKAFPESSAAKQDSMDPKLLNGYFEAAVETLRTKANDRDGSPSSAAKQDSADIATLKKNRSSIHKEV